MKIQTVVASLLVAACSSPSADVEAGPVILQCDGRQVSTVMKAQEQRQRFHFKIDGVKRTFQILDEKGEFQNWGDGTPKIEADSIQFVSSITEGVTSANRSIRIDRKSGEVVDEMFVNIGGTLKFVGKCKPVTAPEPLDTQF